MIFYVIEVNDLLMRIAVTYKKSSLFLLDLSFNTSFRAISY